MSERGKETEGKRCAEGKRKKGIDGRKTLNEQKGKGGWVRIEYVGNVQLKGT